MLRFLMSVGIALLVLLQPAQAQRDRDRDWQAQRERDREWELLGEKAVGFEVDRDVINIGQSEEWFRNRSYRALRFQAERNDVHMLAVRLVYLNGHVEELRINGPISD